MKPGQAARVMVSYSSHGVVELANGELLDCQYRRSAGRPLCNDEVLIELGRSGNALLEILPRANCFMRADARLRPKPVAANLDRVLVILAPYPPPSPDLLDRYLVAVQHLAIEPLIVLNKWDLAAQPEHRQAATELQQHLDYFASIGYATVQSSCKGEPGTSALAGFVTGQRSILVGQTGVGKSSLIRQLVNDLEIQTGAVSAATGRGTHTTTSTTAYHLDEDGILIDSPGVWEYGLWQLTEMEIEAGFIEFANFREHCRFHNCIHRAEPDCAVKTAVSDGLIPVRRHQAYCRTLEYFSDNS